MSLLADTASQPSAFRRVVTTGPGAVSGLIVLFWFCIFLVQYVWTPHDPYEMNFAARLQAPGAEYLLGTDKYGRDMLSRIMVGSQSVIQLSMTGTMLAVACGLLIGLASTMLGGRYDEAIMRFMDILMSFPSLLLALLVVGVLGPSYLNVVLVIGVVFAPRVARVVRSIAREIMGREFIDLARARGDRWYGIMFVEVAPNLLGPLAVETGVRFAYALFLTASLGFLGLGVQPPEADWGLMVNEGRDVIDFAPWI
ncbi:MAG: ABC transporter permease, partial [Bauldia sp.]